LPEPTRQFKIKMIDMVKEGKKFKHELFLVIWWWKGQLFNLLD